MEHTEKQGCPCCHKTKERSQEEYTKLIHRLNRIEGQIRGIRGMVEKNAYCPDILVQVAAANAALNAFNKAVSYTHLVCQCPKKDAVSTAVSGSGDTAGAWQCADTAGKTGQRLSLIHI